MTVYTMKQCHLCWEYFLTEWTEENAEEEAEEMFGVKHASTNPLMVVVCDECWDKVKPDRPMRGH